MKKLLGTVAATAIATIALATSNLAEAEPNKLGAEQLTAFYKGGFKMRHSRGWTVSVSGDGTQVFNGDFIDRGRWRIVGDKQCSKWGKIRSGAEACFDVWLDGDSVIWMGSDGKKQSAKLVK